MSSIFSGLFGGGAPPPAPLPTTPASDAKAQADRIAAENAALADSRARGRRSTIVGGMELASEEQQVRGAAKQRQRAAATELGG